MANLEKLVKAFEALKVFQSGSAGEEILVKKKEQPPVTKKEKMGYCNVIADCICSTNLRHVADFPKFLGISIETFLMLCEDPESDIRMVADECLNRTIKTLLETNLGRLQVELYKEIKKNGSSRSLRAALWRFADMCHLIRPQKCRPYVVNLLPCVARICRRPEEAVQETLATAMQKICPVLMAFANDTEVKVLLKSFLPNLKSNSAAARRTAASSLSLICQYTRKPLVFFSWLITVILDMVIPVQDDAHVYTLLGVMLSLRHLIPHLTNQEQADESLKGSFGKVKREQEVKVSAEQLVQIYELILHYTNHRDHNVIIASLETLHQLLRKPPPAMLHKLITRGSISRTSIFLHDQKDLLRPRAQSHARLPSLSDDTSALEDDGDQCSEVSSQTTGSGSTEDLVPIINELDQTSDYQSELGTSLSRSSESVSGNDNDSEIPTEPVVFIATEENEYTSMEIGDVNDDQMSRSSSADTLSDSRSLPRKPTDLRKGVSEEVLTQQNQESNGCADIDVSEAIQPGSPSATPCDDDIGSIVDQSEVPLVYCVRLLCGRFLLTGSPQGLHPDRVVRVSVKALALGCVGSAFALYPRVFLYTLQKNQADKDVQWLRDVLLYTSHSDPQLKGNAALLIGAFLKAALCESRGHFDTWVQNCSPRQKAASLTVEQLTGHLTAILDDDSSVAVRLVLLALNTCLYHILASMHSETGLKVLLRLLRLHTNPYWLVKVELLELLGDTDFQLIAYLESLCLNVCQGEHHYVGLLNIQERVVHDVIMSLLADEDSRVRHAAADALIRLIPRLFYAVDSPQQDPVISKAKQLTEAYLDPIMHEWSEPPQPIVHGLVAPYHFTPVNTHSQVIEANLSRVVSLLSHNLNKSSSRHLTHGCIHALCLLSEEYLVSQYAYAWCCVPLHGKSHKDNTPLTKPTQKAPPTRVVSGGSSVGSLGSLSNVFTTLSLEDLAHGSGGGSLSMALSLLTASSVTLDISAHQDILQLSGNLFSGAAFKCLRSSEDSTKVAPGTEEARWGALADRLLVPLADTLFAHVARLLNICAHVIDEQTPGPPNTKPSLPSLPNAPSLSPIKRKAKGKEDAGKEGTLVAGADNKAGAKTVQKEKEKEPDKERNRKDGLGTFYNLPHYVRLYEVLNGAYSNYKISLDLGSTDKFGCLLKVALQVLSQIVEVGLIQDIGKHADEMLNYLKSTVSLEPTVTVLCVQQLLKALFGTNLSSQWESSHTTQMSRKPGKATRLTASMKPGLYHSCFITPYTQFTQSLANANFKSSMQLDSEDSSSLLGWLKKRAEKKIPAILRPGSKTDKNSIANYIRLFEPLVIKALKQYTITSSLELQRQVLNLLAQLVQLRVNYCLLDSDQIFIGFVIKQFEFIEEGQIRNSETLIPHIFHFLVLLSYERYHSKTIIGMPKIIQLCDGIMASGQQPTTHAIPALQPILHDLFVLRSMNKADAGKDLETQREVVVSMLLRLIQYYQALEMFIVVLHQCHKESEEKWKRLSRQVIDLVIPLLIQQQLNLENQVALDVVHRLFESVAPSVFRPVDILLKALFSTPTDLSCIAGLEQWMCLVLSVLRVLISQSKEEVVLSRLQELALTINIFTDTVATHSSQQTPQLPSDNLSRNKTLESPEETFARFLLQVIGVISAEISTRSANVTVHSNSYVFLCQQLSHLLLYITHMFQSGLFRRVTTSTMTLIRQSVSEGFYSVDSISEALRFMAHSHPVLTLQWCNILTLLNYDKQEWWSSIMQTPPRYTLNSPNRHNYNVADSLIPPSRCCSLEIVRRGGLVLFCDYVCENLNDAEQMTWVIINHVSDLIQLSHEPPVQDFISAIHRNSAASGLFIQAIHARCENMTKPLMVKKTLLCLEAIHLTQSGALLTLLIDKFLNTHHLSVARMCDSIACRRLEMLLAENLEDSSSQLPLEDLEKLLQFMKTAGLMKRHARLVSLLNKLRNLMCPESVLTVSPDKTHPLAITASDVIDITVNKDWYLSITRDACFSPTPSCRECAAMLSQLDYTDILSIIMTKEFNLTILEECVALGAQKTVELLKQQRDYGTGLHDSGQSDCAGSTADTERNFDPLLQASQITLFRLINNVINMLPVPHRKLRYCTPMAGHEEQYHDKMEDFFVDVTWFETVFHLAAALRQYLVSLTMFPWEVNVPEESTKDVGRFLVLCAEVIDWTYHQGQLPSSDHLQVVLECMSLILQNLRLSSLIGRKEHTSWLCTLTSSMHQLLSSLLVLPGEKLVTLPNQESQEEIPKSGFDDMHHSIVACDQISELIHCLKTHLNPQDVNSTIPAFLAAPLRNVILGLARLPLLNSYARVPPIVWKMGWMPSPTGNTKTKLPPLPLDYLQEKDILKEFIFRVNTLGWTSRQQFEETWMGLLGVLNPVTIDDHHVSVEEEIERTQAVVLAIRGITSLLIQTTLSPHPGNPNNSLFEHRARDKPLAFLYTRCGRKLTNIRGMVEKEILAVVSKRPDQMTHYAYCTGQDALDDQLFHSNNERELGQWGFYMGQMSVESIWGMLGMLDLSLMQTSESSSGSSTGTESPDSPRRIAYPALGQITSPLERKPRIATVSGLDVHSCLQFLLDQYGQWLSPTVNPRTPLMQFNETIKSIVILSDIFTEKQQFDWMLETLLEVSKTHPSEDVLVHQYVALGVAKAAAVVGMDQVMSEKVLKLLETSLRSTHLPTKVAALYGCLYQLEAGITETTKALIPILTEYILRHISAIMPSTISSQQHVMVMWAAAFYIIENFSEEIREMDFTVKIVQLAVTTASGHEDVTPVAVYLLILRGLERLLLASSLTQHDAETLTKLSVERLTLSSPLRALAALGLLFTCMYSEGTLYTGKEGDQWSPTRLLMNQQMEFPQSAEDAQTPHDPEILIVAMERVTVLFDRIRKGYPFEARIISRVLPTFLADFFPPQDVMNKVIGEFLSSQQPYPQLMANVVFQVFENLLDHRQHGLVQDWVMLSLSNFTQRTPVAMAIWSLTCFFISASTNPWLRSLLPHVVGRMGKTEAVDRKLFCISAHDFHSQLKDDNLKRTFLATFQSVAQVDPAYMDLLTCCST